MFTHKIISKEFENGVLVLGVEFTDGVKTITEGVKPQDEAGFKYWLQSRLTSLNSLAALETVTINTSVDLTDPVVVKTQAELDKEEWFSDFYKWVKIKTTLVDTGVLTGSETQIVALLNKVKTGFKPAYLADI